MAKNIAIGVLAATVLVLGLLLSSQNGEPINGAAGTIGMGSRTELVKRKAGPEPIQILEPKVFFDDIGLLNGDASILTLKRTKDTPARVQLDVDYRYYTSQCADRFEEFDAGACSRYTRTDTVVPGGSRLTLDFSKASPLVGDASETVKIRLSTLEDERIHSFSQIVSDAATYQVKGDGTKISFVAKP